MNSLNVLSIEGLPFYFPVYAYMPEIIELKGTQLDVSLQLVIPITCEPHRVLLVKAAKPVAMEASVGLFQENRIM